MAEKEFNKLRNTASKRPTEEADKEFGRRLKDVLQDHNTTQLELSRALGLSLTMIYRWTSGGKTMRIPTFAKIVDYLKLTTREFAYLLEPYWDKDDG